MIREDLKSKSRFFPRFRQGESEGVLRWEIPTVDAQSGSQVPHSCWEVPRLATHNWRNQKQQEVLDKNIRFVKFVKKIVLGVDSNYSSC